MKAFLRLIRFKNVLITIVSQCLFYGLFIWPILASHPDKLSLLDVIIVILDTALIMAAGNVINDILDRKTDSLNSKPNKVIGSLMSLKTAQNTYILLVALSLLCSLYLAISHGKMEIIFLAILANLGLYLYSKYWKSSILVGNLVVALYCMGVFFVMYYANLEAINSLSSPEKLLIQKGLFLFMFFAAFTTVIREIIKDVEDKEGDKKAGIRTLGNTLSLSHIKYVLIGLCVLYLLCGLLIFKMLLSDSSPYVSALYLLLIGLIIPLLIWPLAQKATDFHVLSQRLKVYMMVGIGFICLFFNNF